MRILSLRVSEKVREEPSNNEVHLCSNERINASSNCAEAFKTKTTKSNQSPKYRIRKSRWGTKVESNEIPKTHISSSTNRQIIENKNEDCKLINMGNKFRSDTSTKLEFSQNPTRNVSPHEIVRKNNDDCRLIDKYNKNPDSFQSLKDIIDNREQLAEDILTILKPSTRNAIFPELKKMSKSKRLQLLCEFIKPMSKKRLLALLNGNDLAESTSTESDDEHCPNFFDISNDELNMGLRANLKNTDDCEIQRSFIVENKIQVRKRRKLCVPSDELEDGEIRESEGSVSEEATKIFTDLDSTHDFSQPCCSKTPEESSRKNVKHQTIICLLPPESSSESDGGEDGKFMNKDKNDDDGYPHKHRHLKEESKLDKEHLENTPYESFSNKSNCEYNTDMQEVLTPKNVQTVAADSTTNFGEEQEELDFSD